MKKLALSCLLLWAAGMAADALVPSGTVYRTIFQDDFERSSLGPYWFAQTRQGSPEPNWGIDSSTSHSPRRSASDSPYGAKYPKNSIRDMVMSEGVDLRGVASGLLLYWAKWDFKPDDYCYVQASATGVDWTTLQTLSGSAGWTSKQVDLSWFVGRQNVRIRFSVVTQNRPPADGVEIDDVTILTTIAPIHDLGAAQILEPIGNIELNTNVVPRATYSNLGNQVNQGRVYLRILSGAIPVYEDSATMTFQVGACTTVSFRTWTAAPAGEYRTKAWTRIIGYPDANPQNDTAYGWCYVEQGRLDVGPVRIINPTGFIQPGVLRPAVWAKNLGTVPTSLIALCRITRSGSDTLYKATSDTVFLAGGDSTQLWFRDTIVTPGYPYKVMFQTVCPGDAEPGNDTLSTSFVILQYSDDVGVIAIAHPCDSCMAGAVAPRAVVHNFGTNTATFTVRFVIVSDQAFTVYDESVQVAALRTGDYRLITFPLWGAATGYYQQKCFTSLEGDGNPLNDTVMTRVLVKDTAGGGGGSYGWMRRCPIPPGPKAKRVKDGGALTCLDADSVGRIYAFKGNNTNEFYMYNILADTWYSRESIPGAPQGGKRKLVKKGAALVAAGGKVYAVKGNGTLQFWQYDPQELANFPWTSKTDVPAGEKRIKEGASMAAVEIDGLPYVYLLKGSNTVEFYRYNVALENWETVNSPPYGPSGKGFRDGSSIAFDGINRIYALKGNSNEFFVYVVDSQAWRQLRSLPPIGISGRKKLAKGGAGIACLGTEKVYAQKGNGTLEWWCYYVETDSWVQKEDYLIGNGKRVKNGGALTVAPVLGQFFSLKGNNTFEFYKYVPRPDQPNGKDGVLSAEGSQPAQLRNGLVLTPSLLTRSVRITYCLPQTGPVSLRLYDIAGGVARTLINGIQPAGSYSFTFQRDRLPAGIYLLRLETNQGSEVRKLLIE